MLFGNFGWNEVRLWHIADGQMEKWAKLPFHAECAVFSPDENYVLFGCNDVKDGHNVPFIWKIREETGMLFKGEGHMDRIISVAFSPDGKQVATGSRDLTVKLWNVETGLETATLEGHSEKVDALLFTHDQRLISLSDYSIRLWNIESGNEIRIFERPYNFAIDRLQGPLIMSPDGENVYCGSEVYKYPSGAHVRSYLKLRDDFSLSGDGKKIISISRSDSNIKILDSRLGIDLCKKAEELRIEKEKSSGDMRREIEKILRGEIYKKLDSLTWTASLTQFEGGEWVIMTPDGYYSGSPDAGKFLKVRVGSSTYSIDNFHERFFNPGLIVRRLNERETEASEDIRKGVAKPPKVKIVSPKNGETVERKDVEIVVSAKDVGGGVDEVRLYQNGCAIGGKKRGLTPKTIENELEKTFNITLVPGKNRFKAVGFSKDRTESDSHEITVSYAGGKKEIDLYLVVVGINDYKNPSLKLNFAVADAKGLKDFFEKKWKNLFNNLHLIEIYDRDATKKNIRRLLSGMGSKEQDVVLVFLAGHGLNIGDEWFFVSYDVVYPEREDHIKARGISSKEISKMIVDIRALKKTLFIDSCKSGRLVLSLSRSVEDRKAIAQLARSTGTHVIAASTDKQTASELSQLGHGVFTYALLQGLGGEAGNRDGTVTVRELIAYIEQKLPGISEKYRQKPQYPVVDSRGQDFPLVVHE